MHAEFRSSLARPEQVVGWLVGWLYVVSSHYSLMLIVEPHFVTVGCNQQQ